MQVVHPKSVEYLAYQLSVALQVVLLTFPGPGSRVDGNVVHVDCYTPSVDEVSEDGVHHGLEGGGGVGETKEHDHRFVEPFVGDERCFPPVLRFDEYLVVTPLDVNAGELCTIVQSID